MNNFTHIYCGSDDIYYCYASEMYRCDTCCELIFDDSELLAKVEVNNREVIAICQEAA